MTVQGDGGYENWNFEGMSFFMWKKLTWPYTCLPFVYLPSTSESYQHKFVLSWQKIKADDDKGVSRRPAIPQCEEYPKKLSLYEPRPLCSSHFMAQETTVSESSWAPCCVTCRLLHTRHRAGGKDSHLPLAKILSKIRTLKRRSRLQYRIKSLCAMFSTLASHLTAQKCSRMDLWVQCR